MLGSSSYRPLVKAHLGAAGKLVFLDEMAQIKTPGQGLELAKGCSPWKVPSPLCRLWDRSLHQLPLTWCQWETDQGWGNWAGGCRGGMGSAGRTQKVLVKSAKSSGGGEGRVPSGPSWKVAACPRGRAPLCAALGSCLPTPQEAGLPVSGGGGRGRVQDAQRVKDSIMAAKGGSVQTPAPRDLDMERISESGSLTLSTCKMGTATVPPCWQGSNKSSECDPGMKGH